MNAVGKPNVKPKSVMTSATQPASPTQPRRVSGCAPALNEISIAVGSTTPHRMNSLPSSASLTSSPANAALAALSGATRRHSSGSVTSANSGIANPRGRSAPTWYTAPSSSPVGGPPRLATISSVPSTVITAATAMSLRSMRDTPAACGCVGDMSRIIASQPPFVKRRRTATATWSITASGRLIVTRKDERDAPARS
jgi:hypothetical protein